MTLKTTWTIALALSLTLAACSDDDNNTPSPDGGQADTSSGSDSQQIEPDLGLPPDLGQQESCASEWVDAINPKETVSTGTVSTSEAGGITTTKIDASAGGMNGAASNPFIYVSFADGSKVEINDTDSKTSLAWDLALKRTTLRVNGGDSGSGQGAVAVLTGTTLEDLTTAPGDNSFLTDDFLDESCNILRDPISNIRTALNGESTAALWYDYDMGGAQAVVPKDQVYVLKRADGSHIKFVIDTFYDGGTSGHFSIRWATL